MNRIKLCIVGACGRLGSTIIKESIDNFDIVGAVESANNSNIDKTIGNLGIIESDIKITSSEDLSSAISNADVTISATTPTSELLNAPVYVKNNKKIINDKAYADSKIHNLSLQGKSKFFVKSYLIQKGIEKDLINETLDNYELKNPNWETKSAKIFAKKKRLGTNNPNFLDKDLAKMARAGFDYNTSKKILGYE